MHGCVLTDPSGNLNLPFPGQQEYLSFKRNMQFGQQWVSLNNIVLLFIQIFLHFWLAEIPRIIHHNQLLSIKFGRIWGYVKNHGNCAANCQIIESLIKKTWWQGMKSCKPNTCKWKGYHFLIECVQKGYLFFYKWWNKIKIWWYDIK